MKVIIGRKAPLLAKKYGEARESFIKKGRLKKKEQKEGKMKQDILQFTTLNLQLKKCNIPTKYNYYIMSSCSCFL